MMGAYKPYMDSALETFETGVTAAEDSMGRYDPRGQIVYDTDPDHRCPHSSSGC